MIHVIRCALILTILAIVVFDASAEILLQEDFEGELDLNNQMENRPPPNLSTQRTAFSIWTRGSLVVTT